MSNAAVHVPAQAAVIAAAAGPATGVPTTEPVTGAPADAVAKIGWGIVGAGTIARRFAQDLAHTPDGRLAAVWSRTADSARSLAGLSVASTSGAGPATVHESLAALLADPHVDVVYIATPPDLHEAHAVAALAAGKAVLVEKPFALDAASAARIAAAARSAGRFCMEAMWMRFLPALVEARRIVTAGELGTVHLLTADFSMPVAPDADHHLFDPRRGGGALLDRGVYGLSLASYLLGSPSGVASQVGRDANGCDETSTILLRHASGALATLTQSMRADGSNEAVVAGTKATLRLHAPYFGAVRLSVRTAAPATLRRAPAAGFVTGGDTATGTGSGGLGGGLGGGAMGGAVARAADLRARLRSNSLAQRAKSAVSAAVDEGRARTLPHLGHGLAHEIEAVHSALRDGLLEHPTMPLDETVRILGVADAVRAAWGPMPR